MEGDDKRDSPGLSAVSAFKPLSSAPIQVISSRFRTFGPTSQSVESVETWGLGVLVRAAGVGPSVGNPIHEVFVFVS